MEWLVLWLGNLTLYGPDATGPCSRQGAYAATVQRPTMYNSFSTSFVQHRASGAFHVRGDVVQLVRTLPCHGRGREFESRRPRHSFACAIPLEIEIAVKTELASKTTKLTQQLNYPAVSLVPLNRVGIPRITLP